MKYFFTFFIFYVFAHATIINPLPLDYDYNEQKALLGKKLFHETKLSNDNTISCASCHNLDEGGDDGLKVSIGVQGREGNFNAPTIFNSRYQLSQFWDGRAPNLKEQAKGPIESSIEMDSNFEKIISTLEAIPEYNDHFKILYHDGITKENILDAIVEFEKALVTPNSRFDKYLRGDLSALNEQEKNGYKLFNDFGCISCHNGINLGSNLYTKVGIFIPYKDLKNSLGRYNVTGLVEDKYFFKVPTLRNIELTAPYLHDGSLTNLHKVVKFMSVYQIGLIPTKQEVEDIVTFLKTLTGEKPKILEQKK